MLSNNLKRIRKSKGLSQEELAIKLNIVRQTVSKWENGLSVPDSDMLITLADELDTSVSVLLGETLTIGIANISDCCVYYLAGSSNIVIKVLVFLSGSGLFLGNVMIGYLWAKFIMVHMNIPFSDIRRNIYRTIGLISIVLLVINIFYPLVFSVSDGRYQRGFAYIIFLIFAAFYILDSLYLYVKRVKKMAV